MCVCVCVCVSVCVCVCVCVLRDSILVISIDEQLSSNTATAALRVLTNLQILQETIVNELSLHCRERERERERERVRVREVVVVEMVD